MEALLLSYIPYILTRHNYIKDHIKLFETDEDTIILTYSMACDCTFPPTYLYQNQKDRVAHTAFSLLALKQYTGVFSASVSDCSKNNH